MPLEHILLPLDLSVGGEAKLPAAEEYARAFGAGLILLHVLPAGASPGLGRGLGLPTAIADLRLPGWRDEAEEAGSAVSPEEARARTYLDAIAARMRAGGVDARSLVLAGPVAPTVLDVAREERVGLIIVGSNPPRARGLQRRTLGSIGRAIVRGAPCPVLIVRPTGAAPAAFATPPVRAFAEDAARVGPLTPRTLGLRTVDVARIIGSVGRAGELGPGFRPRSPGRAEEQRYERVLRAAETGAGVPPVELYKLGYGYYVLDGHRRVAAARERGQTEIDAQVTEYLPVEDAGAQRAFTARRRFERATGLTRIGAAHPETYARLEKLIGEWAAEQGLAAGHDSAGRWNAAVFRPLARKIRARRLNRHFPGERTADIFARLAEHRRAEADRQGRLVGWDEALDSFAAGPPSPPSPPPAPSPEPGKGGRRARRGGR